MSNETFDRIKASFSDSQQMDKHARFLFLAVFIGFFAGAFSAGFIEGVYEEDIPFGSEMSILLIVGWTIISFIIITIYRHR